MKLRPNYFQQNVSAYYNELLQNKQASIVPQLKQLGCIKGYSRKAIENVQEL
ncbi:UNKNOWN [Stylonychia lemnae]|uniref:Uncharacterized protein n=1 Tax=Stylonychia lemnae TaxID=5949 RepID=A0A077ZSR7_STYLE|nr:UNKNOWN [Stylonychia lemnae]|eukprot:CDW72922.1 UNKNOWN [Stylonychia lemnae]